MVVGDYDIKTFLLYVFGFRKGGDSGIYCYDKVDLRRRKFVNGAIVKTVAFGESFGDIIANVGTLRSKIQINGRYRRNAVYVIVAVNKNPFAFFKSCFYSRNSLVHVLKKKRIAEGIIIRRKKICRSIRFVKAADDKKLCNKLGNSELFCKRYGFFAIVLLQSPLFFIFHSDVHKN